MALLFDVESPVICDSCQKPAIRRTLRVQNGGSVSFDTHASCVTDKEWHAAVNRMNAFFDKLVVFMEKLKALSEQERHLEFGEMTGLDFRTIHPDACTRRSEVVITAQVRAFGLEVEVETAPRPLKGIRRDSVLKELRLLAEAAAVRLKKRFEEGRF